MSDPTRTSLAPSVSWVLPVEWTKVREFALAVASPEPGASGRVPVTFPTYGLHAFAQVGGAKLGFADHAMVHGEEEYEFARPLRIGDRLRCLTRLVESTPRARRSGATMHRLVIETEMRDEASDDLVVVARSVAFAIPRSEAAP